MDDDTVTDEKVLGVVGVALRVMSWVGFCLGILFGGICVAFGYWLALAMGHH